MKLQGGPALRKRITAIGQTFKFYGRTWADAAAADARRHVPVDSGRLQGSIRRRNATKTRATVVGHYTSNFVDAGSKAHDIRARRAPRLIFQAEGRTIFAKKVHKQRIAARPFKRAAALEGLRRHPMHETMIDLWNRAA